MNGGPGLRAGGPVPGGPPGLLFRRLYGGGYDLHTVNGVHAAVPKGNPRLRGRHLKRGRLADQRARQQAGCLVTGGIRLSPPPADYAGAGLPEIVSVRFGDEELRRVQALAVIFETRPNAVIREACSFFLPHTLGTSGYHQAAGACRRRASAVAGLSEQDQQAR